MLTAVRLWILLSTVLVGGGWVLSGLHALNRPGYLALLTLSSLVLAWRLPHTGWVVPGWADRLACKCRRRFRRPAPFLFLVLAVMCLLGGACYTPINGDSNAYRLPRVLHWLAHEQWHWIRGLDIRLNMPGANFEWLTAPLVLFTRTDRFDFLPNWISFLLLPGLIFSVFTQLQVRPRAAWWWMWILAGGWCFVLQASTDVNDFMPGVYALASVALALRSRNTGAVADAWLSLLAAALATGVKQTDVPLALLWVLAILPAWKILLHRPLATGLMGAVGLLVSIAPIAWFNHQHFHSWLGFPPGYHWKIVRPLDSPFWGVVGNAFCLPVQNFMPPVFPWTDQWNAAMGRFVQTPFGSHFASFECFGVIGPNFHGVNTAIAGVGLGVCTLAIISLLAAWRIKRQQPVPASPPGDAAVRWLRIAPFGLLLLFMATVGTNQNARHLSPYYPFFFPLLLAGGAHAILVRRRWWQNLGHAYLLVTALMLVMSRDRPLFPQAWLFDHLKSAYPHSRVIERAARGYAPRVRAEEFKYCFAGELPPDERTIGYAAAYAAQEPGLWLPLGRRTVERLLPDDTNETLAALGIHYVVMDEGFIGELPAQDFNAWLKEHHGRVVDTYVQAINPTHPVRNYLIEINP